MIFMNPENSLAVSTPQSSELTYASGPAFDHIQRVAKCFSESALVPAVFQKNIPNTVIALEMANRIGASPLAVMQNLYIVHGKPSWASQFIIACLNTCGRFEPLMFEISGTGDAKQCVAWTTPRGTKLPPRDDKKQWTIALAKEAGLVVLDGAPCSIDIAKKEGWFSKNGSKWQTMPDLMLRYRAATFFGRIYAPELLMGMKAYEEVLEAGPVIDVRVDEPVRFSKPTSELPPEQAEPASDSSAPSVSEPAETPSEKPKEKPAEVNEATQAEKLEAYYRDTCQADFAKVMAVMVKLQPSWSEVTAKSFTELADAQQKALWGGRPGISREIKKLNAK